MDLHGIFKLLLKPQRKNEQMVKMVDYKTEICDELENSEEAIVFEFSYLTFFCLRLVSRRALVMSILRVVRMVNGTAVIINP